MATDELITDVVNRLGFSERDEIARRKALYYAKSRRGLVGVVIYSVIVFICLVLFGAVVVSLDLMSVDEIAGDISHIWGLATCIYLGIWSGEYLFKKSLLKHISEGALND